LLASRGYRVVVPYLRKYGMARFLSKVKAFIETRQRGTLL